MTLAQLDVPKEAWNQGGYFVLLLLAIFGAWAVGRWLANEFFKPMRDAAIEYLKNQTENTTKNTEALEQLKDTAQASQQVSKDMHAGLQSLAKQQEQSFRHVTEGFGQITETHKQLIDRLKKSNPDMDSGILKQGRKTPADPTARGE